MTNPQIFDVVKAILPDVALHNVSENSLELHGAGGLNLSVTFDTKRDLSTDYENFSCAPFVRNQRGERQLGHWFDWPFDDMYMEVSPDKLKRLWLEVNAYRI